MRYVATMAEGNPRRRSTPDRTNARAIALLEAAEAILAESGAEALNARAVAERAGVAKGLVFYYWGSTRELFREVLERYYERHKAALADSFAVEGTLGERIRNVVDTYLTFMEANRGYARIVQQQIAGRGSELPLVSQHLAEVLGIARETLAGVLPDSGPLSARHFQLSLSALVINYFTYAPLLTEEPWPDGDALSAAALAERRDHVRWVVDAWLAALANDR